MRRLNIILSEAYAGTAPRQAGGLRWWRPATGVNSRPQVVAARKAAPAVGKPGIRGLGGRRALLPRAGLATLWQQARVVLPTLALFLLVSAISWVWYTGRWDQLAFLASEQADASVASLGLTVDKVLLARDPRYLRHQDLRAAIGANAGGAIVQVPPAEIRANLLSLPWVAEARVERRLPNILYLDITERQPLALWQNQAQFHLLDENGAIIRSDEDLQAFSHLPRLVGSGADGQAVAFLKQIARYPGLASKLFAAVLVNDRRWDLHFHNGVRVLLPEEARDSALERLANLDKNESILDRDVVEVDLRLPDRMVVRRGTPERLEPGAGGLGPDGIFSVFPNEKPAQDGGVLGQPT